MQWLNQYQLFLFDFDGLLVNTEEIHFAAYKRMCANRGITLSWDFQRFCKSAHFSATQLQEDILSEYPSLQAVNWKDLYEEKKSAYMQLLEEGSVGLMPGAEKLLLELEKKGIKRCVVTHSPAMQIEAIRKQNPVLDSIPTWITREQYVQPKPHPEAYQKAIDMLSCKDDAIIGFEDSPRGLQALMGTKAKPILICPGNHPGLKNISSPQVTHYTSFLSFLDHGPSIP